MLDVRIAPPPTSHPGYRVVRILLGVLLLVAAALKAHGLTLDPLSQESFLASPRLLVATIEMEILLGLWLLSGWAARGAWVVALGFFAILAGVSLYLALAGQASCGCFGQLAVSPWAAFGLDIAAVAALLIWRPGYTAEARPAVWLSGLLKAAAGAAAFLVLIVGAFFLAFDDPAEVLARLRGESITVEPGVTHVGDGIAGEQRTFPVQLINHTSRPIRIVGGTTTCACIATGDLPATVPPHGCQEIRVWVRFTGTPGRFQHRFVLYTDDDTQRIAVARFAGRVIDVP
jgi:hypothetical protein